MPDPIAPTPSNGAAPAAAPGLLTTPPPAAPAAAPSAPPPGNAPAAPSPSAIQFPENWKQGLPTEFQNDPAMKLIHDVPSLAKSYLNAQKLIGADKVPIPGKHATDEDWKGFFQKVGLPAEVKDYALKAPDGAQFQPGFIDKFKEVAMKNNILPKQAEGLLSWYDGVIKEATKDTVAKTKAQRESEISALKTEWGGAFDNKILAAQIAFKEFGTPEAMDFLDKSGLSDDPRLLKVFAKIGETMKEDEVRGGVPRGDASLLDPATAKFEVAKIMGDSTHPYFNASHPNHKAAVDEVAKLNAMAYPEPLKD